MAKGKKSFILYCDQQEMFEHLPPEMCKNLLLHLFNYVNDKNPISDDPIINALFAPIKHQLKRDLVKWEIKAETSRKNGKLGGRPKTKNNPTKPIGLKNNPTKPVNVNVNDTVTDKELKEKYIEKIKKDFYQSLTPFVKEFKSKTVREFYDYWSEPNKSKTKIKYQLEKTWDTHLRLLRWVKNDFGKKKTEEMKLSQKEQLDRLYKKL